MKKKLVVLMVLLLGIGGAVLPPASLAPVNAEEVVITLDEAADGTPVDLRGDQTLVIDLEVNLSTGYVWQVAAVDDAILKQVGQFEFKQDADAVGSAGRQILRFRAVGEGQTDLALVYRRPWEDAAPLRDYAVQVRTAGPFEPYEDADAPAEPPAARDLGPTGTSALPTAYEWCSLGGCTPVKDQGYCGSCWAFATVGVVESLIKISDGMTRDVAEQYLVSCNIDGWNCEDGGSRAFPYFIDRYLPAELEAGAVYETDYPYTSGTSGNTGTCTGSPHDKYEKLISWGYVAGGAQYPTVEQIKQAIYDYGPLYVSVCAGPQFQSYNGGVFSTEESIACGGGTNHGVVLVGWDDSQGSSGVWYLRNSWGTGWGESLAGAGGYMRIEYGTSNVGRWPSYAVYEPAPDVSIEKTVIDSDLAPGDPVTFTLSIANSGEALAAGVVVTDVIPTEVLTPTFDSTLAITPTGVVSYVWNVEPLSPGESGSITITGWIDPALSDGFSFTNWASISDPDDRSPLNNTSSVSVGGSDYYLPLVMYNGAPAGWVTIASEDFEGTFPGSSWAVFDANPTNGDYYWGKRNCRDNGGSYSGWGVGAGDTTLSCGSNYPNYVQAWMIYGPFSLADASAAELSFDWWSDTEVNYDVFFWGASADGSNFSGTVVSGDWSSWTEGEVLDLGSLTGDGTVWIAFVFESDVSIRDRGSFVDNIVIRKYAGGAAPSGGDSTATLPTPGPGRTIEFTTIRLER